MNEFFKYLISPQFLETILVVVVMFFLLYLIKKYLIKKVAYTTKGETHKNTLKGVVFNILQYVIILIAIFSILKINGLNITGLITGLGIVATIIGLALQDTIKDVLMGINIYNNNFYKVGDVVKYENEYWEVKFFNARVTKLKSLFNGSSLTLVNSQVTEINKIKDFNFLLVHFGYEDDKKLIDEAFNNMIPRINDIYGARSANYWGIVNLDGDGVQFGIGYNVSPKQIVLVSAAVAQIAYEEFMKVGVVPQTNDNFRVKQVTD